MDIIKKLSEELKIGQKQALSAVKLIDEGNTIPFIARYRKEATGSLSDEVLRELDTKLKYLRSLEQRKEEISRLIDELGALTDEIADKISLCATLSELEDIYRPFRPKRKTRASVAKEKGLEPLARRILLQKDKAGTPLDYAMEYINEEKGVNSSEEALLGALDIIAEEISDNAGFRKYIRSFSLSHGIISVRGVSKEDSVYSMYYDFSERAKTILNHRVLAIDRGEREEKLKVNLVLDETAITDYIKKEIIKPSVFSSVLEDAIEDSYKRLISPSIEREIRSHLTERAEEGAIKLFGENLKHLLMQPPIKGKTVLGLDPGYRTGCKIAVCDPTGKVLKTGVVFCTLEHHDKEKSARIIREIIDEYNVELISIGNGTASGESEKFISEIISSLDKEVYYIMTNEAGASVYSASKLASEEFPSFSAEERSAASIARRAQDPLSELVKIEPGSIGVGQYQHDVSQKALSETLSGVVESCVNNVGVDLNTASWPLLSYVAGITRPIAKNIVKYREEKGSFTSRKELLKVDKLGPKAYLQCAGFLKIQDAENVLDSTRVHPESYEVALKLIENAGITEEDIKGKKTEDIEKKLSKINIEAFAKENNAGKETLKDIADSLLMPDRDPRDNMPKPVLKTDILTIESLKEGMVLKGTVRNVIDFGAFVDIGVHEDGLVHISEICEKYIKHPSEVLKVGDVILVKVLHVDIEKKRISLSKKQA